MRGWNLRSVRTVVHANVLKGRQRYNRVKETVLEWQLANVPVHVRDLSLNVGDALGPKVTIVSDSACARNGVQYVVMVQDGSSIEHASLNSFCE